MYSSWWTKICTGVDKLKYECTNGPIFQDIAKYFITEVFYLSPSQTLYFVSCFTE